MIELTQQSSDEEIQRAVAEEMGWKWWKFTRKDGSFFSSILKPDAHWPSDPYFGGVHVPHPEFSDPAETPDLTRLPPFHLSLDACHEFEKDAPPVYWTALIELLGADEKSALGMAIAVARATPLQRCIAFLTWKGRIK